MFERQKGGERVLLLNVDIYNYPLSDENELKELTLSSGAAIIKSIIVNLSTPQSRFFIGSGKVHEIAEIIENEKIELVICGAELTAAQEKNLEEVLRCRVIDRTRLILDIFAIRARTYEGKLQVEKAQIEYINTRLIRGWTHLERQKGGIGLRGPGETQLESDRRILRDKLTQLNNRLKKLTSQRQIARSGRLKYEIPLVGLVGYTNAGKSTLFNLITDSNVYAKNQLFATLDTTLRSVEIDLLGKVIFADTVGFINNLPHKLIDSFKATLQETLTSNLILHIIDSSYENKYERIQQVEDILTDIKANKIPILKVFNKIDLTDFKPHIKYNQYNKPESVYISSLNKEDIYILIQAISEILLKNIVTFKIKIIPQLSKLRSEFFNLKSVKNEYVNENNEIILDIKIDKIYLDKLLSKLQIPYSCFEQMHVKE